MNSGGSALGISLIKVLKEHFPDHKINYVSNHSRNDLIDKAYPHLRDKYPDVNIIPSPIRGRSDNYDTKNAVFRKMRGFIWALSTLLKTVMILCPSLFQNKTMTEIKESHFVVGRGTNVFYDKPNMRLRSFISMYWLCFPLLLSQRYGVQCIIYAQSIGPIHSKMSRLLLKIVFSRCDLIMCREEISVKFLKHDLGIEGNKIRLVPDSVFALDFNESEKARAIGDKYALPYKRYLAITVRESMVDKSSKEKDNLFKCLKGLIRHALANGYVDKVAIVTQCHNFPGYNGFESDSAVSQELFNYLGGGKDSSIVLLDEALSPDELLALYGCARYLVGMRLHATILALIAGTPCIALSYWGHKTVGIMQSLNMNELAKDLGTVTESELVTLLESIESNYISSLQSVKREVSIVHKKAVNTPEIMKAFISPPNRPIVQGNKK